MKAINYILGLGGFTFAVAAVAFAARLTKFAWRCHDLPLAASCIFGMVWFSALAVKFIGWAWSTPGGAGESGRRAAK